MVSFCSSCRRWLVRHAVSGANAPNWATKPRKERSSFTLDGFLNSRRATNLGRIPPSEMICPANWMLLPISNFFPDIVMLLSAHLCRTVATRSSSSASEDAHMIVSSTIFMEYGKPTMMMSDCLHHSSDDAFSPIGARR